MQWISEKLDATWKRVLAAAVLSGAIILAVSTFASSSYVQTQKVQIESARGQHCLSWKYQTVNKETHVSCNKWANP
ncbi:hypothetical protein EXS54_00315 [Patescibacteria group bacterium]|nr:hypothetical protein [Patescibacteria group bacterium]